MKITASDVNKLRQATGAGMMDCKKALEESGGDFDKAIEVLRKKGQKVAANRADRESSEGVVLAKVKSDNTSGIIISLNCETDFVAKNDDYVQLAQRLSDHALGFTDKESFLDSDFEGMKVSEKLLEQIVDKYDLPDKSKALRCLLDYLEEKESDWDDMFATVRCNRCG